MDLLTDYDNFTYDYMEYGLLEETTAGGYRQKEVMDIISVVIYSFAFVIGLIGNGIMLWVTAFKAKRTVNSVWLQNLAAADFVFVLFLPFSIDYVLRDFNWIFGLTMCKLNSFVCTVNMYASVLSITVLSLDRYITLVHLRWCQRFRTMPLAWGVCAVIWVVSSLVSSTALIYRETIEYYGRTVCFNNFHEHNRHTSMVRHVAMVTLRTTVGFLLPFLTIIVTAVLLAKVIRQSEIVHISSFSRMILAIILAFFLCWTPFHIFSIMELFMHYTPHLSETISAGISLTTSLAFFNSCINPVLYGLFNKRVRAILKACCMRLTKNSLRELSQNQTSTELMSVPATSPPEEKTNCSTV